MTNVFRLELIRYQKLISNNFYLWILINVEILLLRIPDLFQLTGLSFPLPTTYFWLTGSYFINIKQ